MILTKFLEFRKSQNFAKILDFLEIFRNFLRRPQIVIYFQNKKRNRKSGLLESSEYVWNYLHTLCELFLTVSRLRQVHFFVVKLPKKFKMPYPSSSSTQILQAHLGPRKAKSAVFKFSSSKIQFFGFEFFHHTAPTPCQTTIFTL